MSVRLKGIRPLVTLVVCSGGVSLSFINASSCHMAPSTLRNVCLRLRHVCSVKVCSRSFRSLKSFSLRAHGESRGRSSATNLNRRANQNHVPYTRFCRDAIEPKEGTNFGLLMGPVESVGTGHGGEQERNRVPSEMVRQPNKIVKHFNKATLNTSIAPSVPKLPRPNAAAVV
jgi:hypothetical protein